jgi:hypothetical protein
VLTASWNLPERRKYRREIIRRKFVQFALSLKPFPNSLSKRSRNRQNRFWQPSIGFSPCVSCQSVRGGPLPSPSPEPAPAPSSSLIGQERRQLSVLVPPFLFRLVKARSQILNHAFFVRNPLPQQPAPATVLFPGAGPLFQLPFRLFRLVPNRGYRNVPPRQPAGTLDAVLLAQSNGSMEQVGKSLNFHDYLRATHNSRVGLVVCRCVRRVRRRNCSPYCRTIAAAGYRRMPTPPRSSMKAHSAAIR